MEGQLNITMLCAVLALSGACLGGCGMQGGFVGEPSDTTASQIPPMAEDAEVTMTLKLKNRDGRTVQS